MGIGIVKTTLGLAKGIEMEGINSGITMFKGIPYAAPPVGNLRWRAPQPAESWEGVHTFDTYAPIEVQYQSQYAEENVGKNMSEDCLYLNICTPAERSDEKLPVFVWLHGGGLTNGGSYHDEGWEPYSFAKRGNVVVSIGHRINIWGFMALPQLSAEQGGKSGNYGVMDLVQAMDWIWDNIEQFGGDRNNITAGGDSGGTQKTCLLASIPAGKDRIRRVYNSSGLKWRQVPFLTLEQAEAAGIDYLQTAGIDPNTPVDELRAMDTMKIHSNVSRAHYPGEIIYDGDLIPEHSFHELFDKYLGKVDFINVTSQGESNVFAHRGASGAYGSFTGKVPVTDRDSLYRFFRIRLGDLYDKYDFESLVAPADEDALYAAKLLGASGASELASNNHSRNNMVNRLFGVYMKEHHPDCHVYSILWTHVPPTERHDYGTDYDARHELANHCSDVQYFFNTLHWNKNAAWTDYDRYLSETLGIYMENFVKTGNVNSASVPEWPETADTYSYLEVGDSLSVHTGLENKIEEMCREYVIREYGIED